MPHLISKKYLTNYIRGLQEKSIKMPLKLSEISYNAKASDSDIEVRNRDTVVSDMPIYWFAAPGGSRAAAFLREGLPGILLLSEPRQAWTKAR
jgi:hypothetical protein